ncbi:MAG: VCBS repeat-containing protein [Caldilineaceae bacterium]
MGAEASQIYRNNGWNDATKKLSLAIAWTAAEVENTTSLAWGDMDGDGRLDLAVSNSNGSNKVYRNNGWDEATKKLSMTVVWTAPVEPTYSVVLGDMDDDGHLDLAVGNNGQPNRVYRNNGWNDVTKTLSMIVAWTAPVTESTQSIAWGDMDGDGHLDLAVGNTSKPNKIYKNNGSVLGNTAVYIATITDPTWSVAWGDMDGDGRLDLAVGNYGDPVNVNDNKPNRVYRNMGGGVFQPVWTTADIFHTRSVAWGDADGDGDLDLAVGNDKLEASGIYKNEGSVLQAAVAERLGEKHVARSMAWGDVDGDGDLDLAVGYFDTTNKVYLNDNGVIQSTAAWTSTKAYRTTSVAWGDMDGDGDLDLAIGNDNNMQSNNNRQPNEIYRNDGWDGIHNILSLTEAWESADANGTQSVAWGDVDGDGDLDLAAGNEGQPNNIYLNTGRSLQRTAAYTSTEAERTSSVAWGDVDGDGDLDLAAGNNGQPSKVYLNEGGALQKTFAWEAAGFDKTKSVAWGDIDGDGDLDLAVGNDGSPNKIYRNNGWDGEKMALILVWTSADADRTQNVAWGDMDGDGDLDLAVGNYNGHNKVYRNEAGVLQNRPVWAAAQADFSWSVAWGDMDGDGDLDLAAGYERTNMFYTNTLHGGQATVNAPPEVRVTTPFSATANFYALPQVLAGTIAFTYTLFDREGDSVGRVAAFYSLDGGGSWREAVATTDTITTNLATVPSGRCWRRTNRPTHLTQSSVRLAKRSPIRFGCR